MEGGIRETEMGDGVKAEKNTTILVKDKHNYM